MAQEQTLAQNQTVKQPKKYLIRVVFSHNINIHVWDKERRKQFVVYSANQYKLFERLISYVKEHGKQRIFKAYYSKNGMIYHNDAYELSMTKSEIMGLLNINSKNANSGTLLRLKVFLTELKFD